MESDEFIKSSIENLVPIPKSMLNHDSLIISSSSKIDSLLDKFAGKLTLLKSIPPGVDKTDCHPENEIRLSQRLLYDNSSPRPPKEFNSENSNAEIESFSPSPIPNEDSDSFMEEIDLFLTPDDPMPPSIEDNEDSEWDILFLERLLHGNPFVLFWKLVDDSLAATLETQAATMANTDNTNRNIGQSGTPVARKCSYKEFMRCQPFNFRVKFATGTLTEEALSWWNSFAQPIGIEESLQDHLCLRESILAEGQERSPRPERSHSFDVVIGMDWLSKYHARIICDEKFVHFPIDGETLIIR
nr:reverse transcriptase domain-containing protein [Tanacetum cinerariifolium]